MIHDPARMLATTVQKLYSRGARHNIQRVLVKTHTADVAEMLQLLSPEERADIFRMDPSWDNRATVLSYLDEETQKDLLKRLDRDEVLKLVSLMDRDDAADLLGILSEEESRDILEAMVREDSEEVADLMGYPEDSAGGLMSSDYLGLNQMLTVRQAIEAIQNEEDEGRVSFYVYVINDNEQLVGVVSLKQLLLSKKTDLLKEIMYPDVISVTVDTPQEEVARVVERYDFLALPVVDRNNNLTGVITVDDVIDVIREEAEEDLLAMGRAGWGVNVSTFEHFKARVPWLLLAFIGGSGCFAIVNLFAPPAVPTTGGLIWLVAAFIPMILSMGATTGSQAATVAVSAIRAGKFDMRKAFDHWKKELRLSLVFATLFGGLVLVLGYSIYGEANLSLWMAAAIALQIVIAMIIGSLIPIGMHRAGWDPTIASVPLFTAIADLSAVIVLFGMYHAR